MENIQMYWLESADIYNLAVTYHFSYLMNNF